MASPAQAVADQALQELLEVSPQVEAALIADRDGTPIAASLPGGDATALRLGSLCAKILEQAERSRSELGREPVTQCEIATGQGNVFAVADATHLIAAITGDEPTVGLVFYDLKTALRAVREARGTATGQGDNGASGSSRTTKGAEA